LILNCDSPVLCLLSRGDYKYEPPMPSFFLFLFFFFVLEPWVLWMLYTKPHSSASIFFLGIPYLLLCPVMHWQKNGMGQGVWKSLPYKSPVKCVCVCVCVCVFRV
jgi:hypothetical protein